MSIYLLVEKYIDQTIQRALTKIDVSTGENGIIKKFVTTIKAVSKRLFDKLEIEKDDRLAFLTKVYGLNAKEAKLWIIKGLIARETSLRWKGDKPSYWDILELITDVANRIGSMSLESFEYKRLLLPWYFSSFFFLHLFTTKLFWPPNSFV